jgi:hypothetical protein
LESKNCCFQVLKNNQNLKTHCLFENPQRTTGFHERTGSSLGGDFDFSKKLRMGIIYQNEVN